MHDETVNHADERALAAFLDRLVAGEPGQDGVDPALAETARELQDRAARSTASAPPAGTLAAIRADLFEAPVAPGRHHAALGIVPGPALLTRPALQLALAAAILLAVLTGFATFRGPGWLSHVPTGTHSALAATGTTPLTAQLAMSPDTSAAADFVTPGTATCPMPQAQAIDLPVTRGGQVIHAWGLGTSPLWLVGLGQTPGWYHPTDPGFVVSGAKAPSATPTGGGNATNVLWLMDPEHPRSVTVRGKNTDTGADLLFQTGGTRRPTSRVSFTPGPGVGKGSVLMWWTDMVYPEPGCYEITATWAAGSWTIRLPLPAPANAIATPAACATPGATPSLAGEPGNPVQSLMQPPPPFATKQPPIPYITPGIQQIATRPGVPLITPTPFATIVIPFATPATPAPCSG